ncbi:(2,3-dihydroxybenzoyl)adenylate synthase [Marinicellulosiphila megalodicopiae]|uniref:(2,3-dihydroxybenzoyl)adenylate synthase n=1 Tax=Marinicellulosiphila megalodicopiae TaxID=2724896 RepID=UPI003BAE7C85
MKNELNGFVDWPEDFKQKYKQLGFWSGEFLGDMIAQSVINCPEKIAIIDGSRAISYQQLNQKSNQLALGFKSIGLVMDDVVVLQSQNQIEFFEVLFAFFKIGVKPILALPAHRYFEIDVFCKISQAKMYLAIGKEQSNQYAQIGNKIKQNYNDKLIVCLSDEHLIVNDFIQLNSLYHDDSYQKDMTNLNAEKIALFQLSGGTTGMPKLIARTHNDYHYSVRASNEICGITQSTVYLSVLPVMHNFSLSSPGALGVLYAGGTIVLSSPTIANQAFELIEKYKVTISALVPPLLLTWLQQLKSDSKLDYSLESLEVLQVGGAKLSKNVATEVNKIFGCQLQQVFGMAEGLVNYTRLYDSEDIVNSTQGRPISEADEVIVVDDNDQPLEFGQRGHLLVRGPYTIRGYYKNEVHNKTAFTNDGFYRTGDIVTQNHNGYITVEDRSKDQINRGGEKISAEEIENHLINNIQIFDAAVVAMPDEFLGERSCAFLIMDTSYEYVSDFILKKTLLQYLRSIGIADYKIPDRFEILDAFPKTKFGKVNKVALREMINKKINLI